MAAIRGFNNGRNKTEMDDISPHCMRKKGDSRRTYRLTPYIITFSEGTLTQIDIQNLLEAGLRIVRFRMSHVIREDKVQILTMLEKAIKHCCNKYEVSSWPVAVILDLPNSCIRTGYISKELGSSTIKIKEGSTIILTSDTKYWDKCAPSIIFMDDPFTMRSLKPNMEISFDYGSVRAICIKVINDKNIECLVTFGGEIEEASFICIRGIKLLRPPMNKNDKKLIQFVKDHQLDVILLNSVRYPRTVERAHEFFAGNEWRPLILSTIGEQEGLDNIDEIIKLSDGIVLAREFLTDSLANNKPLLAIELSISAKCRKLGKPFFVSGNILENTLKYGRTICNEIADVTNLTMQGCGVLLRLYATASNILTAMEILNSICQSVETITLDTHFWQALNEQKEPVNASDATIIACAAIAKQMESDVIIVLTVTGKTAKELSRMELGCAIIAVTRNPAVARRLQLYKGVIPIIYEERERSSNWHLDTAHRIKFAVTYAVKNDILGEDQAYIVLRKNKLESSYCDVVTAFKVTFDECLTKKGHLHRLL